MSECDLLDLASVSKIQNNGFLVVTYFDKNGTSVCIRNVSVNIGEAPFSNPELRHDARLFVGKCVSECFCERAAENISLLVERCPGRESNRCSFTCDASSVQFFVELFRTKDGLVFQIVPDDERLFDAPSHTSELNNILKHTKLFPLFEAACTMVSNKVAYDRSMVYQFQDDLSGKVVYEWIKPSAMGCIESYAGMFFPASDIPLPARQMLLVRPLRVIFDNDAEPVDVIGAQGEESPDLSMCTLRANHPVHVSYMKNMGLRSSMSIGIVVENQLWGLMCFHAYGEAVYPSGWVSTLFESLSTPISACITSIYNVDYDRRRENFSSVISEGMSHNTDVFSFFAQNAPNLLKVLKSDCVVIQLRDRVKSWGDSDLVPSRGGVGEVSREAVGKDWALGKLSNPSRGVISMVHGDLTVVFIRESVSCDKTWAGDPSYIKIMRPDGVPGPRGSFERYIQSGADSLNKWNQQDKRLATYVSYRIKLVVMTVPFFTERTNSLLHAHTICPKGQVGYATLNGAPSKRPLFDAALISHFSHELKTPLQGISSVFDMISIEAGTTNSDSAIREHARHGMNCVKTLTRTVNSVLSIAGGGSHAETSQLRVEHLSLDTLIDTVRKEFRHLTVTSDVDKEHSHMMVNSSVLEETLFAIIRNSLQSIDISVGTIQMTVSCCSTHREAIIAWQNKTEGYSHRNIRNSEDTSGISDSDTWYTFSVKDSGCGIHGDMVDNVLAYDHHARSSTGLTNSHQGVGVGIYECISNIIFHMSGSVAIASTVSEGTFVSIVLPAQVVEIRDGASTASQISEDDIGVFFVVDDNIVNRKLAARLVKAASKKKFGFAPEILEFSDGKLCIEEVKRMSEKGESVMGVLMDHHMPVMSGKEATIVIRQLESCAGLPKIPIIGFTADSTDMTREELLNSGMDDVLFKPLSMKLLEETCVRMMMYRKES